MTNRPSALGTTILTLLIIAFQSYLIYTLFSTNFNSTVKLVLSIAAVGIASALFIFVILSMWYNYRKSRKGSS